MWRENFKNLLRVYDNNDNNDVFITASDILRSIAPAMKSSKIDKKHNCIRLGRTLAEVSLAHNLIKLIYINLRIKNWLKQKKDCGKVLILLICIFINAKFIET